MPIFRKGSGPHALAIAMTAVRMGERLLWIGAREMDMFAAIGVKAGLTGQVAAVVSDEAGAETVRSAARRGGILVDVEVGPGTIPFADASFDVAVITGRYPLGAALAAGPLASWVMEVARVLRGGGRLLVIERFGRPRLFGLIGGGNRPDLSGQASEDALRTAGLKPVRTLARRDGLLFVEGLRPNR